MRKAIIPERKLTLPEDENPATRELTAPWRSRVRMDRAVTGTIELAFLRGYQAGYEDAHKKKKPRHFVNL